MVDPENDLLQVVQRAIASRVSEIIEDEAGKAKERIYERIRGETARLAMQVMEHYEMRTAQGRLIIEVKNLPGDKLP